MTRRGRRAANELTVIYWRDIPAQVSATVADHTSKRLLDPRFQTAIDRAAGVADCNDASTYVAQWRREHRPIDGDPEAQTKAEAARIDQAYPRQRLQALVRDGGIDTNLDTPIPAGPPEREEPS